MNLLVRALPRQCRRVVRRACCSTATAPSSTTPAAPAEEREAGEEGEEWPRRLVSGLQPTGALHVGNYFGAVRRLVRAQDAGDHVTLFVADLHALSGPAPPSPPLSDRSLQLAALLLAAGVDPARSTLFVQSHVPRHAELCWLLACLSTQARVSHLPQYRTKSMSTRDVPLGLLLYPVLQAADVLLHRATHVPVGADQLQHLQLAQHLARAFQRRYGRRPFPVPRAMLSEDGAERIRSLRDPSKKMSKSDPSGKSRLELTDSDDDICHKIRRAVTDFTPQVTYCEETRPGVSNLVRLHCLAADLTPEEVVEESDQLTTAQYKAVVAAAVCDAVRPLRARYERLVRRPRLLRDVLRAGAAAARGAADDTYRQVVECVGLLPSGGGRYGPDADRDGDLHALRPGEVAART